MMNRPRSDATSLRREAWIEQCIDPALELGAHVSREDYRIVTGVDPAVGKRASKDRTSIFTICSHRESKERIVLDIRTGNWTGPEILAQIENVHLQFKSRIYIESNAAQGYIRQFLRQKDPEFPIYDHRTGIDKSSENTGVVSVFTEFEKGVWRIPEPERFDEVARWLSDCLEYHPKDRTGDRLMACWIAREGLRRMEADDEDVNIDPNVLAELNRALYRRNPWL